MGMKVTAAIAIAVTVAVSAAVTAAAGAAPASSAHASPVVRVNQAGYPVSAPKTAFVMLASRVTSVPFTVTSGTHVIYSGVARTDAGYWNANYRAVYRLDFSAVRTPGSYQVHAAGAVSPVFPVADPATLYTHLVGNAVRYFTSERDGGDVISSVMGRRPANLTDARAWVYAAPAYDSNDNLLGGFTRTGGPVDVSGGWFDAGGGYEKFAYTASYADALMLIAQRDYGGESATLGPEANFGLQWLAKLWNPAQRVLYVQVGIGNGSAPSPGYPAGKIQGDYNFWVLPQAEDQLDVRRGHRPGPTAYFVKYRPVFAAAPPGGQISPDLAGRLAADFALGAQLAAARFPGRAAELLARARSVFALAKTSGVGQIVTTYPHDYYPGTQWTSDMLWGAAELALADEAAGATAGQVHADLASAAFWARRYLGQGHADTFNLYDTGAIGEAELLRAMRNASDTVIPPGVLLGDMAAQLRYGQAQAAGDPFQLGAQLGAADATPHAFGLFITDALYREYGGSGQFTAFAQQQLNFALGGNGWGASFVVGAGRDYPRCMQSEIANLTGQVQLGATTDGPSAIANFTGLGSLPAMRACAHGDYAAFNTKTAGYEDNVVAWPSVEPAADYTAASLFAFALGAAGLG